MGAFDFPILPGLDNYKDRSAIVAEHRPEDRAYAGYVPNEIDNVHLPKCEIVSTQKPESTSNFWYYFWLAFLWVWRGFCVYIVIGSIWRAFVG